MCFKEEFIDLKVNIIEKNFKWVKYVFILIIKGGKKLKEIWKNEIIKIEN